jgi:MFS family permease
VTRSLARYLRSFTGFSRDARRFLITTVVFGAAISLYWIDFNLYLEAIGIDRPTIGWLLAVSQLAGVVVALPASAISNRVGRRSVMAAGMALVAVALFAVLPGNVPLIFVGVALFGAGSQIVNVVQVPYIAEHTRPDQRNEFFATWSALGFMTGLVSALLGGAIAQNLSGWLGLTSSAAPYQVLLVGITILGVAGLGTVLLLTDDRHTLLAERAREPNRPGRFGLHVSNPGLFAKLLLPGFITSLGAGQLIPFLNVFIQSKFDLDLASLNAVFAITSLGTTLAILMQPAIARRFGRIGSIVLVQGASIPFLVVLGFSPLLWTVVIALAVRNSLMNAGSPIFDAFAMEKVSAGERATLSALMTLLWALGWTVAPIYYGTLQAALGFTAGYAVDFVTIIVLYTVATSLLWTWFRDTDRVAAAAAQGAALVEPAPTAAEVAVVEGPASLLEHA